VKFLVDRTAGFTVMVNGWLSFAINHAKTRNAAACADDVLQRSVAPSKDARDALAASAEF
jgi:hypothetical protein